MHYVVEILNEIMNTQNLVLEVRYEVTTIRKLQHVLKIKETFKITSILLH
jgi:hypothetical protein